MLNIKPTADAAAGIIPRGRWLHIIPTAFVMYTIAYIDRTNISMALPAMSRDLHMTPTQAGGGAGIFFWGYLWLQIPGGYLAERWSAKRLVGALLAAWGICSVGCAFVHTTRQLYVMRFLLGITEGGVWPATLVLLASWFPRGERARANSYWMLCQPAAVMLSSPLSGWILKNWNWRVLLATEGALPLLWLVVWWRLMDDHPEQARWIDPAEREYLESTLSQESAELAPVTPQPYLRPLGSSQVWLMALVYFTMNCSAFGYLFWLPSLLKSMSHASDLEVGFLYAAPYLMACVGMVLISRHSDRLRERRRHVAVVWGAAGVFLLLAILLRTLTLPLSFLFLCLTGTGIYGALGPFWAIPGEIFPRGTLGSVMGLINAVGALGGYFGPLAVGYLTERTGRFLLPFCGLSVGLMVSSLLMLMLRAGRGEDAREYPQR